MRRAGGRSTVRSLTAAGVLASLLTLGACSTTWAPSKGPGASASPTPSATASGSGVEASWGEPTTTIDFTDGRGQYFANRDLQPAARACSPVEDANSTATGGMFKATVGRITDAARLKKLDAKAKAWQVQAKQTAIANAQKLSGSDRTAALAKANAMATNGCAYGAFTNGMVGSQGLFAMPGGKVSVRVKFPVGQGMHFAIWMQSERPLGTEIDFIESYGYGKGLTSGINVRQADGSLKSTGGKILKTAVKDKAWWAQYHIFSVAWDQKGFTFYADGAQIRRIDQATEADSYYLVLSGLTSDWELPYLTAPSGNLPDLQPAELPASMEVDWIRVWKD